jgi:hypothetical protein
VRERYGKDREYREREINMGERNLRQKEIKREKKYIREREIWGGGRYGG